MARLTGRKEWQFFAALSRAAPGLAALWWLVLVLRGVLPAAFAIAMGVLIGGVERGEPLAWPLALVGAIFVVMQVVGPIHQALSANLGVSGMAAMIGGLVSAAILAAYTWWAPLVLAGAWLATHWLLRRERGVARSQHRRGARRAARRRLRVSPRGRSAGEQGAAAVRPRRLDDRAVPRPAHAAARAAVRGDAAARAAADREPGDRRRRQPAGARIARRGGRGPPAQPRRGRGVRAERDRRVDGRDRRVQLGARRRGGAGRRGAAARAGDASRRCAAGRNRPGPRDAGARDPVPRRDVRVSGLGGLGRVVGARAGALRSDGARRVVARDRRAERRRQDHDREALVPAPRSAVGRDRDRRRRSARARSGG